MRRRTRERGSVTLEFAVALPALLLLVLVGISAVRAVLIQLSCVDAAREAALVEARGGDGTGAGNRLAPAGAAISVSSSPSGVRAAVSVLFRPLGGYLPGLTISAESVAAAEPGGPE